jgi:hypothetical protein
MLCENKHDTRISKDRPPPPFSVVEVGPSLLQANTGRASALIKKRKSNFPHIYVRKFRMEQLQRSYRLTASSFMGKYLYAHFLIYMYSIRKPFLIYDFAAAPL